MSLIDQSSCSSYISVSDREKCSPTCRANYSINYHGRSGIGRIIVCDGNDCTRMYITIGGSYIACSSCSLYTTSLYYKLIAFCTKHSLLITTSDGCDNVSINNPTSSLIVELNNIIKELLL